MLKHKEPAAGKLTVILVSEGLSKTGNESTSIQV